MCCELRSAGAVVRTAMAPVLCVCSYLLNATAAGDINQCYCVVQTEEGCMYIDSYVRWLSNLRIGCVARLVNLYISSSLT